MAFPARVFRVLIASPSDVSEERELAVRIIQEWNDLNAAERQLVMLPLRWETHAAPEYGRRPQEVINRQVVDQCDLLVGVFWTRIGGATGGTDSGTIEEIERVASAGKPVMLYFSSAKQDPDLIDLDQLGKLRDFKKQTFPKALIESYSTTVEFRDKLARQIEIQLRQIIAEQSEIVAGNISIDPVTDIVLHFADAETGADMGDGVVLQTRYLSAADFDRIPDYETQATTPQAGNNSDALFLTTFQSTNKDYLRERATALVLQNYFRPLRFWLKNRGGVGARDVYVDLRIASDSEPVSLIRKDQMPQNPTLNQLVVGGLNQARNPELLIRDASKSWTTKFEVSALQPQRELSPSPDVLIGAKQSCDVKITARIFADTLPEPSVEQLTLRLEVESLSVTAEQLYKPSDSELA